MKRVFVVHGWGGSPEREWFPWLKKELEARGLETHVLEMPNTNVPTIKEWIPFLAKAVKKAEKDTYFVGHSVGCQTILRYLQTIDGKIGGVVFVAGWLPAIKLNGISGDEIAVAKPWIETPIDFERAKNATKNFTAIFSDNDPYVAPENAEAFRKNLGAKIIIEKKKGHFTQEDGCTELPAVLDELLKFMKA